MRRLFGGLLTVLMAASAPALGQTCLEDSLAESTPESRFVVRDDGTVLDAQTGLVWTRCSVGQTLEEGRCQGTAEQMADWGTALSRVADLNSNGHLGHSDWRLPSIKELNTLVDRQCHDPAINLTVFPDTPSAPYFSGTPDVRYRNGSGPKARMVNFFNGTEAVTSGIATRYIRLVRNASGS